MKSNQASKTMWIKQALTKKRATAIVALDDGRNQTLASFITPLSPRSVLAKEKARLEEHEAAYDALMQQVLEREERERAARRLEKDQAEWAELNRRALERETEERADVLVDSEGSFSPSWIVPCLGCKMPCDSNTFCDDCCVDAFFEAIEPDSQPFE